MTRRWLIDLPTRIHLWSAEFQIRHRSSSSDPARLRNHNAVRRIAATANLARVDDMNPADLTWADRSGLTRRELARRTGLRQGLVGATVLLCTLWSVLGYMTVWMGGIHRGDGLTLIWFGWAVVIAGPIVATVVMLRLVSRDRVREAAVAPITGAAVGVLMTIVTGAYLIVGAVDLAGREPEESVGDGGLPLPYGGAVSGVDVSFPIGFGALLIGLLVLAWSTREHRRGARV